MTPATDLCGVCGEDCYTLGRGEYYYEGYGGTAVHVACRPRKGTDAMPIKTGFVQKHAGPKGGPYFGFDLCPNPAEHPHDPDDWKVGAAHDALYSYQKRDRGPDVILNQYIEVTYSQNESNGKTYLNVESWREVAAPEGQPSPEKVAATVSATQGSRDESFYRTAALKQAVIFVGTQPVGVGLQEVDIAYLHFLKLLTNPASLREPGDVENHTDRAPKPVLDHNAERGDDGYLVKSSDAERASQDAAAPVTDPADPKYVERYAPA